MTSCENISNGVREENNINNQNTVSEDDTLDCFDRFLNGDIPAFRLNSNISFFITELSLDNGEWDSYSIGDRLDLDNDGEDELVLYGPYGGMYLDKSSSDDYLIVFAEGEGTAMQLSYVFYDNAYWIIKSDTTHAGRKMYSFTKYSGVNNIVDSFELNAEYGNQDYYDENSDFTYRDRKITMEEYEQIYENIFDKYVNMPKAYQEILEQCSEIIVEAEDGYYEPNDSSGSLYWFADQTLHSGDTNCRETFCYSLADLNNDGTKELILAQKLPEDNKTVSYGAEYTIFNIYTFNGEEIVKLAESSLHNRWYINSDGLIINECTTTNGAHHEVNIYSMDQQVMQLNEQYHIYSCYSEDRQQIELYESDCKSSANLICVYDHHNNSDLWAFFHQRMKEYTSEFYSLELVPICQ